MDYYKPDNRWELYQVSSVEEYTDKFVVKGRFHSSVPTDIQDAWQTVEYLLAHAYYHWPMYDEGFKKALLIIEMAVKLKAKELGISLEYVNKKGKKKNKNLIDVINEVFKEDHYKDLKAGINRVRNIRNTQMHPERHTYLGVIANVPGNIKLIVNLLNTIFKEVLWHQNQCDERLRLREYLELLSNSLLVLDRGKQAILIRGILDFNIHDDRLIIACNPIRTDISDIISKHKSVHPIILQISNYHISKEEITGLSNQGDSIRIYRTEKEENLSTLSNYRNHASRCTRADKDIYMKILNVNTNWDMVNVEYENLEDQTISVGNEKIRIR